MHARFSKGRRARDGCMVSFLAPDPIVRPAVAHAIEEDLPAFLVRLPRKAEGLVGSFLFASYSVKSVLLASRNAGTKGKEAALDARECIFEKSRSSTADRAPVSVFLYRCFPDAAPIGLRLPFRFEPAHAHGPDGAVAARRGQSIRGIVRRRDVQAPLHIAAHPQ